MTDPRQYAPATHRNRDPILAVLQEVLPATGTVLEISSGTGEHAAYFAPRLQPRQWLPSDLNPLALASIAAWRDRYPADNLHAPIALDTCDTQWSVETSSAFDTLNLKTHPLRAMVNINMIHIAPWSACLGLMAGAERVLPPEGILYLYGPFRQSDRSTAPSNEAFDASLRAQNPAWGLRNLDEVRSVALQHHLTFIALRAMPANNLSVIFQKQRV
ncbi:MAG: DUF938 domain-containing protein [Cyanobacteria bacterium J06642_2]